MNDYGSTERVRRAATEQYIEPARRRGQETVTIHSGTFGKYLVERNVLSPNRFPIICNALRSKRFVQENHLTLTEVQGPPSGRSSTVTFVYKIESELPSQRHVAKEGSADARSFANLRGILKKSYAQLGGAAAFHRHERESWNR